MSRETQEVIGHGAKTARKTDTVFRDYDDALIGAAAAIYEDEGRNDADFSTIGDSRTRAYLIAI